MTNLTIVDIPTEGVLLCEETISAFISDTLLGRGALYITENYVCWRNEEGRGFSLRYPEISLHAVSRDLNAFPHPCIYVMVDSHLSGLRLLTAAPSTPSNEGGGDGMEEVDENEEGEDDEEIVEIRFVPDSNDSLDLIHQAISDGNMLHPDEDDSFSDDEDDFDPEDAEQYIHRSETNGTSNHGSGVVTGDQPIDDGQFEDAVDDDAAMS